MSDEKSEFSLQPQGWFGRMWGNSGLSKKLSDYSQSLVIVEKELELYRLHMNIQNFNPLIPLLKLISGCLAVPVSLLIFVNLLFGAIIKSNGSPIFPLLDKLFNGMEGSLGGVFTTIIFFALILYFQLCMLVGISKIGLRFVTLLSVHPLQ